MIDFQYLNHQNMNLGQLHGSVCNYIYTVWLGISGLYITIQLLSETCQCLWLFIKIYCGR